MKITSKGKVEVNKREPYFFKRIQVLLIDLCTKRAEVGILYHNDIPTILLSPAEDSVHLSKSKNEFTELSFPEFKGWIILTAQVVKYDLYVTFVKEQ